MFAFHCQAPTGFTGRDYLLQTAMKTQESKLTKITIYNKILNYSNFWNLEEDTLISECAKEIKNHTPTYLLLYPHYST